jgi:alkylation response protein AidB-like acyl-CoA dehydrogenase
MDPPLITPPIDLHDYRARAREWLSEQDIPEVSGRFGEDLPALRAWQRTLYDGGWMGISWPREAGGQGLSLAHQAVFSEEMARFRAPAPPGQPGLEVVGPTVIRFGSEEQRRRILPPLLTGEELWSLGMSEPNAGSDLAAVRTRARPDGDGFVLNGQKIWTTYAQHCDGCLALCRTNPDVPKHDGLSFFLVWLDTSGITIRPIVDLTGDNEFCELFFDDVRVSQDALLGQLNDGWTQARESLGMERGPIVIRQYAHLAAAFAELLDELDTSACRESDLVEIGRVQVMLHALQAQKARTLRRLQMDVGATVEDSGDKLLTAHTDQAIFSLAMRLLAHNRTVADGVTGGLRASRWRNAYFYSRAGSIYAGTDQVQRDLIARRKLKLPRAA